VQPERERERCEHEVQRRARDGDPALDAARLGDLAHPRHAAERPERDVEHLQAEAHRDDAVGELVEEDDPEEGDDQQPGHERAVTRRARRVLRAQDDESEQDEEQDVHPDRDAEDAAELEGTVQGRECGPAKRAILAPTSGGYSRSPGKSRLGS
jgi:hypothetical protein